MFLVNLKGNGNASTYPQAAALGEGFASVMGGGIWKGTKWLFKDLTSGGVAEQMDFNGHHKPDGDGDLVFALPYKLYEETGDATFGGWSLRILWDLWDGTPTEPWNNFTRYNYLGQNNPPFANYGAFDKVGASGKYRDVMLYYLSGNYLPTTSSLPDIDDQGYAKMDMTEVLDGMLCRGLINETDMMQLVNTVMDFRRYTPTNAPPSCP